MNEELPGAGTVARQMAEMLDAASHAPWRFGFFALLRRLAAAWPDQPPIGLAARPRQEAFRLGQAAALAFAPREIAEIAMPSQSAAHRGGNDPSRPLIRLYGLGMLGSNGPLPLHFTEIVRDRMENAGDSTLADFLDLFHHRYLTHIYRAWAQSQSTEGLDRRGDERFSRYIARLTGHDPGEILDSVLPSHARLAAAPHLGRETRHPDGLAGTLAHFFAIPVRLREFMPYWICIAPEERSRLGSTSAPSVMGAGAVAGEVVADRQGRFRLVLGPLTLERYLRLTPQGCDLPLLVEWVRAFVGHEFAWDVELRIRRDSRPPARLEALRRLGWSTWLGGDEAACGDYTVGMVFEPERYMGTAESP
ncbi:type VI secretion system baseplate subunit TssG [Variovorax sp. Varisp41]|uniref:type VI secretion system baseplate subunit TssG n=1 Tax=Variovorax sp. Varisp41 TaxID=3243033 RepID=UPI0039B6B783